MGGERWESLKLSLTRLSRDFWMRALHGWGCLWTYLGVLLVAVSQGWLYVYPRGKSLQWKLTIRNSHFIIPNPYDQHPFIFGPCNSKSSTGSWLGYQKAPCISLWAFPSVHFHLGGFHLCLSLFPGVDTSPHLSGSNKNCKTSSEWAFIPQETVEGHWV